MQEKRILTKDNIVIALNHFQIGKDCVLIIAPGWFMTKDSKPFQSMSKDFSDYCDVITFDFRGHGNSGGNFTFTSKEFFDLDAILGYAKTTYKTIYLMGFSLGGATSIITAAKNDDIAKMIIVSTPCDFNKIENCWWKKEAWIPTLKKCEPRVWMSVRAGNVFSKKIKPIDEIKNVSAPTLFVAGEKDPTVCEWHTKSLFEKAVCEKKFIEFKNCYHAEDLYLQRHDDFIKVCRNWLFDNK